MEANRKDYNLGDENKKSRPASPTKGADDMVSSVAPTHCSRQLTVHVLAGTEGILGSARTRHAMVRPSSVVR